MKKVLTILLTLVMAIGLVSLNNNHASADNAITIHNFKYENDTWSAVGTFDKAKQGDILKFTYVSGQNSADVFDPYLYNNTMDTAGDSYTYIAERNNTDVSIDARRISIINDYTVQCDGIRFDGTDWYNGTNKIDDNQLLTVYGIDYTAGTGGNPGTAKLSKSIAVKPDVSDGTTYPTLDIEADLNIVLNDNLVLANVNNNNLMKIGSGKKVTIDGKGYSLDFKLSDSTQLLDSGELSLKNVFITSESESNSDPAIKVTSNSNIKLDGNANIEIMNPSDGGALQFSGLGNIEFSNNAEEKAKIGNASGDKKQKTYGVEKGTNGLYYVNGTQAVARYIKIVNNYVVPKPSPDTSKGEMQYDKKLLAGEGAFTFTGTKGKVSKDTIAYIKNFVQKTGETVVTYLKNGVWEEPADGIVIEISQDHLTNAEQYTKVILKPVFMNNYLSIGDNLIRIQLLNDDGVNFVYYAVITINNPVDPSPSKKDESCEKVIGPTWHWNNDKGICEDYGVVGTSTR